jgi:hypothetical protein
LRCLSTTGSAGGSCGMRRQVVQREVRFPQAPKSDPPGPIPPNRRRPDPISGWKTYAFQNLLTFPPYIRPDIWIHMTLMCVWADRWPVWGYQQLCISTSTSKINCRSPLQVDLHQAPSKNHFTSCGSPPQVLWKNQYRSPLLEVHHQAGSGKITGA